MKTLTSTSNETVKHLVKLQKKSYRQEHQQFIAQGLRTCTTFIEQKYELVAAYLTEDSFTQYPSLFDQKNITLVSLAVMNKISTATNPSGILAVFKIPQQQITPTSNAIILYNIQDPGNLGTLIRTAAAMNINTVYLIRGVDPYSPKVIQSTTGTIAYVTIVQTDWETFTKQHKQFHTCGLVVTNGQPPEKLNIAQSILIIGNEAQGLPQNIIDACSEKMTIPMPGNTESLNAAVAGSIAMYIKSARS